MLDARGIDAALREYVADFEARTQIACAFIGGLGGARLESDSETVLYRVAQLALANVAKHARAEQSSVELAELEGGVVLIVADDGVGFEPRRCKGSSRQKGFGLLSLRERVASAGGTCRIVSRPGRGTRIEVTLPWRPQTSRVQVGRATAEPSPGRERGPGTNAPTRRLASAAAPTVLVADYEHSASRVPADALRGAGFDVVGEAGNGAEAVDLAERLRPELLLMNLRMPVLNGQEVARLVRARQPGTQIVLLSSDDDPATVADCLQAGVFAVVAKAVSAGAICATLRGAWLLAQEEGRDRGHRTALP
jgi:CheY-like chemotaxis protein